MRAWRTRLHVPSEAFGIDEPSGNTRVTKQLLQKEPILLTAASAKSLKALHYWRMQFVVQMGARRVHRIVDLGAPVQAGRLYHLDR